MSKAIVHRKLLSFAAIVALAGAHCGDGTSDSLEDSGPGPSAARDAGPNTGIDSSDGRSGDGDSATGLPKDSGAGPAPDAGSSICSPTCSGGTPFCDHGVCKTCTRTAGCGADSPVCDTRASGGAGQCKQVEVVAFYTPDPDMHDRAHAAYARHANTWFPQTAADQRFFTYESTTDWTRLKTMKPAPGRVIMFLDNYPPDADEQAGFQSYVENGGGWIGCHVSAYNDDSSHWDWYFNEFLGCGHFNDNTWSPTPARLDVLDSNHPFSKGLGSSFESAPSEWYSWVVDLRTKSNIKILLAVDPTSFPLGTDPNQSWYSGYYPIAWTNTKYNMLYLNMGHEQMDYSTDTPLSSTFDSPTQNKMYANAFRWLGGATP
jgi:type 1 glutamine amidotransferase